MFTSKFRVIASAAALICSLAGCAANGQSAPSSIASDPGTEVEQNSSSKPAAELTGEITVLAAASLTESFTVLSEQFMIENDGVKINLSFGSSSALALTVAEGSPVDVLATADLKSMDMAIEHKADAEPVVFVGNDLVIAVANGNPHGVEGLAQLSKSDLLISKCAPEVPCGRLTESALAAGGLTLNAVTEGADVKATFAPLITGEVDAALVYRTDAIASADVDLVDVEAPMAQQTQYPMVVLSDSKLAQAFYDYLLAEQGTNVFTNHGFTKP